MKRINGNIVRFEKQCKYKILITKYDSHGFDSDGFDINGFDENGFNKLGFNKEGFDKNGFDENGFNKIGFNREKVLVDIDKTRKATKEDCWNIFYAIESVRDNYELIKECVENEPNTYEYASPKLKNNIDLARLFIEKGGSFNLLNKNLRSNKSLAMLSLQNNPKHYNQLNKKLKDDDDIFALIVKLDKRMIGFASKRLRAIYSG